MSSAGLSCTTSSTSSPTMPLPSFLIRAPSPIAMSGCTRKRIVLWWRRSPRKTDTGGGLRPTRTSHTVSGRHLPTRIRNGTPAQRQVGMLSRSAAKVSTVEVLARGRLHREQRHDLEHVVLNDIADGAGALVEAAATLDAEALGHRHLDAR